MQLPFVVKKKSKMVAGGLGPAGPLCHASVCGTCAHQIPHQLSQIRGISCSFGCGELSFFKTQNKGTFSGGKGNLSLQNASAEAQDILSHQTLILPLLSDLLSNIKKINQQRFPEAPQAPR